MPVPSAGARTIRIAMLALSIAGLGASTPTRIDGSQVGIVSFDLNDPAPAKISTLGVGPRILRLGDARAPSQHLRLALLR
jgi:hypothetical protein